MSERVELQTNLATSSEEYAAQLPEMLKQIVLIWSQFSPLAWDEDNFQAMLAITRGLAGTDKTFGFAELSATARELEIYLHNLGEAKRVLVKEQRDQVKLLLSEMNLSASKRSDIYAGQSESESTIASTQFFPASRRVFVLENEQLLTEEIRVQLSYFGYEVNVFSSLDIFCSALQQESNVVALVDVDVLKNGRDELQAMAVAQRERAAPLRVIFMSEHDEMDIRLESVRAGGVAYLNKPLNMGILVDILEELTSSRVQDAYRVLIVDDSASLTDYFAAVLEQAGMTTRVVNDPLNVMKPLLEFSPDLILIDMYMPGCNGMELARVIRQINAYISIPIVFLSSESNLDKQLIAIGFGGDDFLTKPIEPQHLISSVTSRIKRSLKLRSFMVRDSLTNLINHTTIKSQLGREVARAKRQKMPLAFAMIDIDNFKTVNDTYGHPTGDQVIKNLARLLKQRLRSSDLIGRYGGEEFAVVLVDADCATAVKVIDNIRNDFAQLRHMADGVEFTVTFSCGVADVAHFGEATLLTDAADKALYKAKHAGRNQIMSAMR